MSENKKTRKASINANLTVKGVMAMLFLHVRLNCVMNGGDGEADKNDAVKRFVSMEQNLRARLKRRGI